MSKPLLTSVFAVTALLLTGCGSATVSSSPDPAQAAELNTATAAPSKSGSAQASSAPTASSAPPTATASAEANANPAGKGTTTFPAPSQRSPGGSADSPIDGVGDKTWSKIPKETSQVLVSRTEETKQSNATTMLYERNADGNWSKVKSWRGHNGGNGWATNRTEGDKTSPAGVFSISDAGGYKKNPGSKLPYTRDDTYRDEAVGAYGNSMKDVFNYVIAINFNRRTGEPPTDGERPDGSEQGGKIWLHVDHDSPTRGCITIPEDGVRWLLKNLDPANKPMIILGSDEIISA
ncbi:L,D-transpeptidase family protein [Saxibacter everestensis]|uniref:L,D-transpeptidase family protein n=1 Tax=Saxibacter everestensis TaxID=2909229 RepID=A0ABY8QWQ8_9MICO|nr:L,D-transpeptidase family protein [Brevibacteriaceae bacterium ZFBP1038]